MSQHRRKRYADTGALWALLLLALAYLPLLYFFRTITGKFVTDGVIGVVLGLYICSRPAANAIDLLFFHRGELREAASGWSGVGWLALNILVLFAGWLDIWIGALRFTFRVSL